VLGFSDRGALVRGLRADLIVWNTNDVRGLTYIPGGPSVSARVIGGVVRE
jgi:imidazolonepropionase-like amidohydrolase